MNHVFYWVLVLKLIPMSAVHFTLKGQVIGQVVHCVTM